MVWINYGLSLLYRVNFGVRRWCFQSPPCPCCSKGGMREYSTKNPELAMSHYAYLLFYIMHKLCQCVLWYNNIFSPIPKIPHKNKKQIAYLLHSQVDSMKPDGGNRIDPKCRQIMFSNLKGTLGTCWYCSSLEKSKSELVEPIHLIKCCSDSAFTSNEKPLTHE